MTVRLPDGSGFFIAEVDVSAPIPEAVRWNPWNKVVQDHRDGTIDILATDVEREKRGLPVPWVPALGDTEPFEPPVF